MRDKRELLLVGVIAVALFASACSGASTPTPTSIPPTATPDMPKTTIGDTEFRLSAVVEASGAGATELKAKPGYRLLQVGLQTDTGRLEHIAEITEELWMNLQDKDGNKYPSVQRGTGIYCPGTRTLQVCWTFSVPENEKALWLILPDGTSIELEPFIK